MGMAKTANAIRTRRVRDKKRAQGLRLVQMWIPDARAPGFAEELARQCRLADQHPDVEVDAWLDELNRELAGELNAIDAATE